ncbi:hypothetical protein SARC_12879 [Sphaeroforma arctica JP610]|uniref:Fe2OG dioxygenase domain-containing protein n=1 Tax=Sphaeroforma arctica JP610 TaxID=667725 RepID=A0A0L0FCV2_9EUKA|nr:hypothetical protein SARC_12879 [Sphaeroforma arctica JP610]KNC74579.1 hypothetical protein SARC_12879 [Sphaeroforma arctica JP610]|eukprot:XP_014148481.1 hypothetical protein SARC_12879 [Sphaeroforma arctica JP610]
MHGRLRVHCIYHGDSGVTVLDNYSVDMSAPLHPSLRWPAPVTPAPGTCVLFSSGDETMHCVTPVKRGTRYSMLFWLSTDRSAGEDAVVLSIMKKLRAPVQMYFDERVFGMGPQATWDYTRDPHLVHNSLAAVGLTVCGDDVCSIGSNNMEVSVV